MYMMPDKYEAVSNISGIITVSMVVLLLAARLWSQKPLVIDGFMQTSVSLEYTEYAAAAHSELQAETAEVPSVREEAAAEETAEEIIADEEKPEETKSAANSAAPSAESAGGAGAAAAPFSGPQGEPSENAEFINSFLRLVQSKLYYPKHARNAGITGTVEIKVTFSADGEITDCSVADGKYHKALAGASLKTMEQVKKSWQPMPGFSKEQTIIIPVRFELK
jgi:TonB family protein